MVLRRFLNKLTLLQTPGSGVRGFGHQAERTLQQRIVERLSFIIRTTALTGLISRARSSSVSTATDMALPLPRTRTWRTHHHAEQPWQATYSVPVEWRVEPYLGAGSPRPFWSAETKGCLWALRQFQLRMDRAQSAGPFPRNASIAGTYIAASLAPLDYNNGRNKMQDRTAPATWFQR